MSEFYHRLKEAAYDFSAVSNLICDLGIWS
jgi:hypothetical protein